jgi:hypothetical protein
MIPTRFALALAACLAVSCNAVAHSDIESVDWCVDGVVQYTGDFMFTRDELVAELRRRQQGAIALCAQDASRPTPESGGDGTCGVFDPPYETARAMARAACGAAESAVPAQNGAVVAVVDDPPSFNAADHHDTFNFDAGLSGMCGVCVPRGATPPPIGSPGDHN